MLPVTGMDNVVLFPGPVKPLILQRPLDEGAMAELQWRATEEKGTPPHGAFLDLYDGQRDQVDADYCDGRWRIEGSPVVTVAAMKMFSGALAPTKGAVSFPAVDANFEDLIMLMHRYPCRVADSARPAFEAAYERCLLRHEPYTGTSGVRIAGRPYMPGGHFNGKLLSFQEEGVAFLLANPKSLLADDMGLGKTVMAFALLDRFNRFPAVIVCQAHVQRHWQRKIAEFMDVRETGLFGNPPEGGAATGLRVANLVGAKTDAELPDAEVYIVHYLVLHAWAERLKTLGIRSVIFDEVQELRHTGTRKHGASLLIARGSELCVGLSGTPIYNHGVEIYNVLNTLNRGALGTRVDFTRTWCVGYPPEIVKEPEMLGQFLRDRRLMIRRRKDDVQSDLPPKRRVIEPIDGDGTKFAELIREAAKLAKDAVAAETAFDRARFEMEAISVARQATGIAKAPAVIAFVRGLMEAGEPTIVFVHHHLVVDAIMGALEEFKPVAITGRETASQKTAALDSYVAGETNLCLISLRAATGIDGLQSRTRCVVFAELDWSPAVHAQAEDRAHRMGQKESVIVYYLVTEVGTDPHIMKTLGTKRWQFTGLMHEPEETDQDRQVAEDAHMQAVLAMLRDVRP